MMFSRDDFQLAEPLEMLQFLPIVIFIGLVAPFLVAAYSLGFVMDQLNLLDD